MKHHIHSQLHPGTPETNNNSLSAGDLQGSLSHNLIEPKIENDSEDQGELIYYKYYLKFILYLEDILVLLVFQLPDLVTFSLLYSC